jgi:SulP family sulfate permease
MADRAIARKRPSFDWDAFTPKLVTVLRQGYGLADLRADAVAGLTVAIIALPLAMALGVASGATPTQGLITAIVAGAMISALGGSRVQVGGPTGAFVVVIFTVIAKHGYDGLLLATLMAGAILVIAGYAGVGRIIRYIPHPVIVGFTAGIAVIIASSQINDLLGLRLPEVPVEFGAQWLAYGKAVARIDPATALLAFGTLALLIFLRVKAPRWPALLIGIAAGSMAVALFGLDVDTIGSRFPDMATGIPTPSLPDVSLAKLQAVAPAAFTIAFLAGIEALLSAVVADGMTGFRHRSGQELVGQGAANIASALFGGLPATGALARTAANVKAGARTPFAGIFHSAFLLLFVLFAADLMALVPMAVLAAVLLIVAWGMSEAGRFVMLLRMPGGERLILLTTFFLTVLVDLTVAIGVGVTLASLMFMARMSENVAVETADEDPSQREDLPTGVEVFRINGPFFFGAAGGLIDAFARIGGKPRTIILRLEQVPFVDSSGALALHEFVERAERAGIDVILSGATPQLLKSVRRARRGHKLRRAGTYAEALALARD